MLLLFRALNVLKFYQEVTRMSCDFEAEKAKWQYCGITVVRLFRS